jgi:hypothetical protein
MAIDESGAFVHGRVTFTVSQPNPEKNGLDTIGNMI